MGIGLTPSGTESGTFYLHALAPTGAFSAYIRSPGSNIFASRNRLQSLGRPQFATDSDGAVVWDMGDQVTPFGQGVNLVGAFAQRLMFSGQYADEGNRVNKSTDTGGTAATGGNTGTRIIAYDNRGNVTTLGAIAFVYDHADQPVTVSSGTNGSYIYDGNMKRVKSTVGGTEIYNVYDASGMLVHVHNVSENKRTDYVSASGLSIARLQGNNATYLFSDHLGSPVAGVEWDSTQGWHVEWRERYTPFGITLNNDPDNKDLAGFTGHIKDSATGLNYMQARYYDPVIGRFLSEDPVGFSGRNNPSFFNRYAYAFNNSLNLVDLDGTNPGVDRRADQWAKLARSWARDETRARDSNSVIS